MPLSNEIDERLAGLRLETAEGRGEIQSLISASELELHAIERSQAEIQIQRANQALDALEIRAPHDGIVVFRRDRRGNVKQVGDIVAERFRITRFLAVGGMGEVYEAEDLELSESVALKTIRVMATMRTSWPRWVKPRAKRFPPTSMGVSS